MRVLFFIMSILFGIIKRIRELFPIECCTCKKKFKAKQMINWSGDSYICYDCYDTAFSGNRLKKNKPKTKGIKTRKRR